MKVFMQWFGGSSYATPSGSDTEEFESIAAAKREFIRRTYDPYYPCVSRVVSEEGGPSGWLYFSDPRDTVDPYPDRLLEFGPRGGLIEIPC